VNSSKSCLLGSVLCLPNIFVVSCVFDSNSAMLNYAHRADVVYRYLTSSASSIALFMGRDDYIAHVDLALRLR
jgi:hypothetical protein